MSSYKPFFNSLLPPVRFLITLGFIFSVIQILFHKEINIHHTLDQWYALKNETAQYSWSSGVKSYGTYYKEANSEYVS